MSVAQSLPAEADPEKVLWAVRDWLPALHLEDARLAQTCWFELDSSGLMAKADAKRRIESALFTSN